MGIFVFDKINKERELQIEIEAKEIQIEQLQKSASDLKRSLNAARKIEEANDKIIESLQVDIKRMEIEQEFLSGELTQTENEKQALKKELEELQEEKTALQKAYETLLEKLTNKDEKIKEEQRIKAKYKFYFENGAMDFSKAMRFFNAITNNNLNETKVRTFLIENNIIYKAGRYYAPTPYAEDFNYAVVYGEPGETPPKYTHDFLLYLNDQVKAGNLK